MKINNIKLNKYIETEYKYNLSNITWARVIAAVMIFIKKMVASVILRLYSEQLILSNFSFSLNIFIIFWEF